MKREWDGIDLRKAFSPEPAACHDALMNAARSVREEDCMKRVSFGMILLAVMLVIAMTTAAYAAGNAGLFNWLHDNYGAQLPTSAQEMLTTTQEKTIAAGPVTFTISEALADGRIAYLNVQARTSTGTTALLCPVSGDPSEPIGEKLCEVLGCAGLTADTSYAEAASITGAPLYFVGVWMELPEGVFYDTEMMDGFTLENGTLSLIYMALTHPDAAGDAFTAQIHCSATELDPETLEAKEGQRFEAVDAYAFTVGGVTAERRYAVSDASKLLGCLTVTELRAEQTCAGVYLTVCARADEGTTLETLYTGDEIRVLCADGTPFPTGASLTSRFLDGEGNEFPADKDSGEISVTTLTYQTMITADVLPDALLLTDGAVTIAVQ